MVEMVAAHVPFMTFNAKQMSARDIANTFVPPNNFVRLAARDHSYLIGPRGSGKTTLLKMLQGECLMAWTGPDAENYRSTIDYSCIFLPADRVWKSQVGETQNASAFAIQLFAAFVEKMIYRSRDSDSLGNRVHLPVTLDARSESRISGFCSELLGLQPEPSFVTLLDRLDRCLGELHDPGGWKLNGTFESALEKLRACIRVFNRAVDQKGHKWALLLDEMELSPPELHDEVAGLIRGNPGELILKVSISPFGLHSKAEGGVDLPAPGHDYQPIYLADQTTADRRQLTEGLWRGAMASHQLDPESMQEVLGQSPLDSSRTWGAREMAEFRAAKLKDPSFADWMGRKDLDLNNTDIEYNRKSSTLRKAYPLIVFRNSLLRGGPQRGRRSRKKPYEPFVGALAVSTELEGNPRWIKSAFSLMMEHYDRQSGRVEPGAQYDALQAVANKFIALLRVVPTPEEASALPVIALTDKVAGYMNRANLGVFTPDPVNSFVVDANIPRALHDSLVLGLYAGAFVHVRDSESPTILTDLSGERFRLAYLLGVRKGIEYPARLGKAVNLTTVLNPPRPTRTGTRGRRTRLSRNEGQLW